MENVRLRPNVIIAMSRFIQMAKATLKAWLVRLCSDRAGVGTGVALLEAQIASLEKRCAAFQQRINRSHHRAGWRRRSEHDAETHSRRRVLPRAAA